MTADPGMLLLVAAVAALAGYGLGYLFGRS